MGRVCVFRAVRLSTTMRDAAEKLQHRRHRPVYLAPTAVNLQHFSSRSYHSEECSGNESYVDDNSIEDLRIPLFVEIPHDDDLRLPITSPPCSNGSNRSPLGTPVFSQQTQYRTSRPFRERLYTVVSSIYVVVSDFLLLVVVCLMGLFFHVEVQVVQQRSHGRGGRVIVQKSSTTDTQRDQREYHSTDLLRPLHPSSSSSSFLSPDDMV